MKTISLQEMAKHAKDEELAVLEAGTYTLEVTRCSVRGDNALLPVYTVVGGPDAGKTVMVGQLTLTEKAASIFFRNLRCFGIDKAFFETAQSLKEVADALTGRIVEMEVLKEEWKGEDRNKFPIGGVKLVSLGSADGVPAVVPCGGVVNAAVSCGRRRPAQTIPRARDDALPSQHPVCDRRAADRRARPRPPPGHPLAGRVRPPNPVESTAQVLQGSRFAATSPARGQIRPNEGAVTCHIHALTRAS